MKCLSAAATGLAVALAIPVNAASYEDTWVLLGLDIHMGAVTTRSFPDLPTPTHGEGLPTFPTKAAVNVLSLEPWHIMLGRATRRGLSVGIYAQTGGLGRQSRIDRWRHSRSRFLIPMVG
jgi:hypothetical protein